MSSISDPSPRDTNGAEYVTDLAYVPPQTITKLYIVSKHISKPTRHFIRQLIELSFGYVPSALLCTI